MTAAESEFRERVVLAVARMLPGISSGAEGLRVEPLSGGVGPRSYKATLGARSWAVRIAAAPRHGALELAAESEIARLAANAGLAPPVVGCDPDTGAFVTEYLENARTLTPESARRMKTVEALARLLHSLHKLRVRARRFAPEAFAAEYLEAVGGLRALESRQRRLGAELERRAAEYARRWPGTSLCHNDLVAANILEDGRLWLIDFEYAVSAAPILDLAGLAVLNDYDAAAMQTLVEAYYAGAAAPFGRAELEDVMRLVRLLAYFWALAAACGSPDPEPYLRFAEEAGARLGG